MSKIKLKEEANSTIQSMGWLKGCESESQILPTTMDPNFHSDFTKNEYPTAFPSTTIFSYASTLVKEKRLES